MKVTKRNLVERLHLSPAAATDVLAAIREFRHTDRPERALETLEAHRFGYGVEFLRPTPRNSRERVYGRPGVYCVNTGDACGTTLLYDEARRAYFIGSWGGLVERQPRRFSE